MCRVTNHQTRLKQCANPSSCSPLQADCSQPWVCALSLTAAAVTAFALSSAPTVLCRVLAVQVRQSLRVHSVCRAIQELQVSSACCVLTLLQVPGLGPARRQAAARTYSNALCSTAQHCIALYCTAPYCTALYCIAQHRTAQRCIAQHRTAQHCIAQHSTAQCCIALHSTELHSTALHSARCLLRPSLPAAPGVAALPQLHRAVSRAVQGSKHCHFCGLLPRPHATKTRVTDAAGVAALLRSPPAPSLPQPVSGQSYTAPFGPRPLRPQRLSLLRGAARRPIQDGGGGGAAGRRLCWARGRAAAARARWGAA